MQKKQPRKPQKKPIWKSWFYRIYFAVVLLVLIGIAVGVSMLHGILADYESAQPIHVAEQAAKIFEDMDLDAIYALDTAAASIGGGDRSVYMENMHLATDGKEITWTETYSGVENEKKYKVLVDGSKLAEFTLVPSGNVSKHGNKYWEMGTVTTFVAVEDPAEAVPVYRCKITVPSNSTVLVNGEALTADNITIDAIPGEAAEFLPMDVPVPTMTEYTFTTETEIPTLSVTDASGSTLVPEQEADYIWRCGFAETPGLKEQCEEDALDVAKLIAQFCAKQIKARTVLKKCLSDSPAYTNIKNFDSDWGKAPRKSTFENIVTSEYYQYNENCFSCRVSFDFVGSYSKGITKTYPTAYTLYFYRSGKTVGLYNFTLY